MCPINDPSFGSGSEARIKFLLLGSSYSHLESLMNRVRSLNIEHVSPSRLVRPEISRRPVSAVAEEANTLALMRRWFFARKPDAGFILSEFPATLLQAKVFDEWLDARDESLQGVFVSLGSNESVVLHYRTLGLIIEASDLAA